MAFNTLSPKIGKYRSSPSSKFEGRRRCAVPSFLREFARENQPWALRWGRRIWPKLAVWVGPDPNPPPGKFPGIFFPEN